MTQNHMKLEQDHYLNLFMLYGAKKLRLSVNDLALSLDVTKPHVP